MYYKNNPNLPTWRKPRTRRGSLCRRNFDNCAQDERQGQETNHVDPRAAFIGPRHHQQRYAIYSFDQEEDGEGEKQGDPAWRRELQRNTPAVNDAVAIAPNSNASIMSQLLSQINPVQ